MRRCSRRCRSQLFSLCSDWPGWATEYMGTSVPTRAEASTAVSGNGVVFDGTDEVFAPLLDCAGFAVRLFAINPVEMRLQVAIGTGYVSDFDGEEDVAIVVGPAQFVFDGLVVG